MQSPIKTDRLTRFINLKNHAFYAKHYEKLSIDDISFCIDFISSNHETNKMSFEMKVNRLFIDKEKPKLWKIFSELLCVSNK